MDGKQRVGKKIKKRKKKEEMLRGMDAQKVLWVQNVKDFSTAASPVPAAWLPVKLAAGPILLSTGSHCFSLIG